MTVVEEEPPRADNRAGDAPIKPEYIIAQIEPTATPGEDQSGVTEKQKPLRGMNRKRKFIKDGAAEEPRICFTVAKGLPCRDDCKLSHDVQAFLEKRGETSDQPCVVFRQYGQCPFGLLCEFYKDHFDRENVATIKLPAARPIPEVNRLSPDVLRTLRQRQLNFDRANAVAKLISAEPKSENVHGNQKSGVIAGNAAEAPSGNEVNEAQTDMKSATVESAQPATVEPSVVHEDQTVQVPPAAETLPTPTESNSQQETPLGAIVIDTAAERKQTKKIDWRGKSYLAPLTTVGNLPFRRLCKTLGVDITCGEMAMSEHLLKGQASELALVRRHPSEDIFGVQVCGKFVDQMSRCTQLINEHMDVDFIDLNLGCPIDLVYNSGSGSGLVKRQRRLEQVVRAMTMVSDIPVTVKIRTGIDKHKNIAHTLIPRFKEWGADLCTLHGRSRQQRYSKLADWNYVGECAEVAHQVGMPFFGNGDVLSYEEHQQYLEQYKLDGVMIGRAGLIKPWIFTEIKEQRHWDISASERFELMKKFCDFGLEHWGSDKQGVNKTRRFLLEWHSFHYRYIPVGLLEVVPQKINERPPRFFGRNDLETLMISDHVSDWIKLSEMLLGKTSDDFIFQPKHKSNAYETGSG